MSVTPTQRGVPGAALRAFGKRRSLTDAKKNIARHYDLGNDVFRLWLDDSLTYSCATCRNASDSLEQAQRQKLDHSLHTLRLHPLDTLLDIGCGWGALVMRAAEHYQANATGITLSGEQYARVNAAIAKQGLQHKASGRLADYNTLPREGRQFDKIVSIGMIEHVGKDNLAGFVQAVARLLKPGGLALLHSITAVREGSTTQWIKRHMFPGAYIPTLPEMITHLGSGLNYFEPGLRLRYEIRREFAPYLGLGWLRRLGGRRVSRAVTARTPATLRWSSACGSGTDSGRDRAFAPWPHGASRKRLAPGSRGCVVRAGRGAVPGGVWHEVSASNESFAMEVPMERISIPIGGMSCGGCVNNVRNALARIPSVQVDQVKVGSATVAYDPALVTPDAIREAIAQAGYQPLAA